MKFTFYGHSCFAIETGGKKLLFDPFITGNELAKDIDVNNIDADYILVSHGHGDHVGDLVSIAQRTGATIIAVAEITTWANAKGCPKTHGMNFGPYNFEFGEVRMVPAGHSSGLPDGTYGGNPGGFILKNEEGSFYFSGDTCVIMDMQLIPRYGKLDFAIMPIGGNYTMNADDAVIAADFVQCDKVIGVHFDTFPPIRIDKDKAKETFKNAGKELILPTIGETIDL
ncbi:MAG: metal-dependent hydrolase [Sphingobacteriales bacterium]|nr:MAG: metal-dependent hydrolase [Sphingobacteriales bacterium]